MTQSPIMSLFWSRFVNRFPPGSISLSQLDQRCSREFAGAGQKAHSRGMLPQFDGLSDELRTYVDRISVCTVVLKFKFAPSIFIRSG
jgi:hypothetical protein